MKKFAPSSIKVVDTKYGEIIKIGFPVKDFIKFLKENENKGWVNLDLKTTKSGKKYLELDTYKVDYLQEETEDEIPF